MRKFQNIVLYSYRCCESIRNILDDKELPTIYISLTHSSCVCVSHRRQACCKLATSMGMRPVLLHVLL
jgi:hypothetical protein